MTAQTGNASRARQVTPKAAPFIIVVLAGMAIRTPLAAAYPFVALLLFLWIVSDTLMLTLFARSSGRPGSRAVLGVFAGAGFTVWLGSPPVVRAMLLETPILTAALVAIMSAHVAWAAIRARRVLKLEGNTKERWVSAASEVFRPAMVRLAAAKVAVVHMALFRWGGPADVSANARPFAYHRHLTPMCATLLVLSAIEIAVYHLLVGHWSHTGAIVMFVLSDVGFVYLIGLIKSFRFRPVLLTVEGVRVRAGFLIDQFIPLDAIVAVESSFTEQDVRDPAALNAALLAWPNILLRLDRPMHRRSFLNKRPFDTIAFRLDDPEPFVRLLLWRLGDDESRRVNTSY